MLASDFGIGGRQGSPQKNSLTVNTAAHNNSHQQQQQQQLQQQLSENTSCRSASQSSTGSDSFFNSEEADFSRHYPAIVMDNHHQASVFYQHNEHEAFDSPELEHNDHPFAAGESDEAEDSGAQPVTSFNDHHNNNPIMVGNESSSSVQGIPAGMVQNQIAGVGGPSPMRSISGSSKQKLRGGNSNAHGMIVNGSERGSTEGIIGGRGNASLGTIGASSQNDSMGRIQRETSEPPSVGERSVSGIGASSSQSHPSFPSNGPPQQQEEVVNEPFTPTPPAADQTQSGIRTPSQPEELEPVPDCDVKRYVIAVGKTLNKSEEQLHPVLTRLVCKNWLETISHLQGLSDNDWSQLDIPRQMVRLLRQHLPEANSIVSNSVVTSGPKRHSVVEDVVAQMAATHSSPKTEPIQPGRSPNTDIHGNYVKAPFSGASYNTSPRHPRHPEQPQQGGFSPMTSTTRTPRGPPQQPQPLASPPFQVGASMEAFPSGPAGEASEVEQFVRRVCLRYGRSQAESTAAVQCLVNDNWFDTVDQLRALSQAQWDVLELPVGLAPLLPAALAEEHLHTDDSLERVVVRAGSAMGRTGPQLETAITRLRQHGYDNAAALSNVTEADWSNLRLPLRLLEEIQKILCESVSPSFHGTPSSSSYQQQQQQQTRPAYFSESSFHHVPESPPGFNQYQRSESIFADQPRGQPPSKPDPRIVTDKESREERLMTVDKFLLKVGLSVGRSEAEMQPVIQKIIKDNWFDSICALRLLKGDEWNALGLPKRLVDALRQGLSDPFVLELNTVQFTSPEPELFPCDVIAAIWKLEGEIPPENLPDTLRSLLKLMETILCNPFDEAKRIIRKSNTNFQKRAGQFKSGLLVLESVGYEDAGDSYLLPVAYVSRITEAHAALAQVAQLHRDRLAKGKRTSKLFSSIK